MKKAIALLLCLLMVTSLVACGNNSTTTDDSQTSQVETENNEASTPEESETPTETETETPTESEESTEEPEPTVSVGWEIEGSVIPIPEPPVTQCSQYNTREKDGKITHALVWLKSDEVKALTEDAFKAFIDELVASGYDQITTEFEVDEKTGFHFEASKADGISCIDIEGSLNDGYLVIAVTEPMENQ